VRAGSGSASSKVATVQRARAFGAHCRCSSTTARVAWAGAGIDLKTDTPTADQIGTAVRTILRQRSYRDHARRIQADFATHRPTHEAAALLERLAASRSPVMRATSAARKSRTEPVSS